MPILARDLVEVIDEGSSLYHRVGVVIGFTRAGRPIVQFRRRRRTLRHPIRGVVLPVTMDADALGVVPPLR